MKMSRKLATVIYLLALTKSMKVVNWNTSYIKIFQLWFSNFFSKTFSNEESNKLTEKKKNDVKRRSVNYN